MAKYKIGDLVSIMEERNSDNAVTDFYGININKEFMPTAANTEELDGRKYKILRNGRFVYSGMQTGRDECIRIGLYTEEKPIIVSPAYTTFEITRKDIVFPEYFFMLFLRKEMDRLGWFYSDSSIRANLDWERFCDIEITLPDIETQHRFVSVYKALLANQHAYEKGLEDLKLTCDAYIDQLRKELPHTAIGEYIEQSEDKNIRLEYGLESVKGVSIEKRFIETKADMGGVSLKPYLLVEPNAFAYVTVTSRNGERISLAHNNSDDTYICSSSYVVFRVSKKDKLIPSYLRIFFNRSEFDRYTRFHSWGSARETFDFSDMKEVKIPVPPIATQQCIVDIYNTYIKRREINEQLKQQIKEVCPILIRGSIIARRASISIEIEQPHNNQNAIGVSYQ